MNTTAATMMSIAINPISTTFLVIFPPFSENLKDLFLPAFGIKPMGQYTLLRLKVQ